MQQYFFLKTIKVVEGHFQSTSSLLLSKTILLSTRQSTTQFHSESTISFMTFPEYLINTSTILLSTHFLISLFSLQSAPICKTVALNPMSMIWPLKSEGRLNHCHTQFYTLAGKWLLIITLELARLDPGAHNSNAKQFKPCSAMKRMKPTNLHFFKRYTGIQFIQGKGSFSKVWNVKKKAYQCHHKGMK